MVRAPAVRVIMAVALPPPVHGQALVSAGMVAKLKKLPCRLQVHDLSPGRWQRGAGYHFQRCGRVLRTVRSMLGQPHGATTFYVVAEAGWGLVYTLVLLAVARWRKMKIFIHHHTAAQVRRRRLLLALVMRLAGSEAVQIVLSACMARELRGTYPLPRSKVMVCGNAAHLSAPARPVAASRKPPEALRLGMLGNLTIAKGTLIALETLRAAHKDGLDVTLTLAGPVIEPAVQTALDQARQDFGERLILKGELEDEGKEQFFRSINLLLFPSRYRYEAQPLVVLEALQAGMTVIAYDRGYVGETLGSAGVLVAFGDDFIVAALPVLRRYAADKRRVSRRSAQQRFQFLRRESVDQLNALLKEMTAGD